MSLDSRSLWLQEVFRDPCSLQITPLPSLGSWAWYSGCRVETLVSMAAGRTRNEGEGQRIPGSRYTILQLTSHLLELGSIAVPSCKGARERCPAKNYMREGERDSKG